jgi:hypothetical protein
MAMDPTKSESDNRLTNEQNSQFLMLPIDPVPVNLALVCELTSKTQICDPTALGSDMFYRDIRVLKNNSLSHFH